MYIGDLIPASVGQGSTTLFTPWLPRQADNAVFSYEVIDSMGGTSLTVQVYHKNREDPGEGTPIDGVGSPDWTASGSIYTGTFNGLKEIVRFAVTTNASGLGVCYRILPPTWYNDTK